MRQVLGIILLAFSLSIGLLMLLVLGYAWVAAHIPGAKRSVRTILHYNASGLPQHSLETVAEAQAPLAPGFSLPQSFISGQLTGIADLQAPLSLRPCSAWNVSIYHWDKTKNRYDAQPIWSRAKFGSLAIPFEQTRYRQAGHIQRTNEGGLYRPNSEVVFKHGYIFPHRSQLAPLTTAYLNQLQTVQLPQEIAATIAANMDAYGVKEEYLTIGDAIQGAQSSYQFTLGPGAEDRSRAAMAGCAVVIFIACLGIGALIGYNLLS